MKISKEMEEKIVVVIQALLGLLIIWWSIRSSVRVQSEQIRKAMVKGTRQAYRRRKKGGWLHSSLMAGRTPLWAGRCFTQTGQRSGGLIINCDQQRSEAFASGLRKWWIPPPLKAPSECLREASPGSQRLFIPMSNEPGAGMFFSCIWRNFLPNAGEGDLLGRLNYHRVHI